MPSFTIDTQGLTFPREVCAVSSVFYEGKETHPHMRFLLNSQRFWNIQNKGRNGHLYLSGGVVRRSSFAGHIGKHYTLVGAGEISLLVVWEVSPTEKLEQDLQSFFEKAARLLRAAQLLDEVATAA